MTPAVAISVIWPTAGEVARAIVAAARVEGVDPVSVASKKYAPHGTHVRAYAFVAIAHEFPTPARARLARLVGDYGVAGVARNAALRKNSAWFDLGKLNAVRLGCGWSDMTLSEAQDATLAFCGRSRTEFVARSGEVSEDQPSPPSTPLAGSGDEKEPAPFDPDAEAGAMPAKALERPKAFARGEPPNVAEVEAALAAPRKAAPAVTPKPKPPRVRADPVPDVRTILRRGELTVSVPLFHHDLAPKRGEPVDAEFLGEPPPGRSALDQRSRP